MNQEQIESEIDKTLLALSEIEHITRSLKSLAVNECYKAMAEKCEEIHGTPAEETQKLFSMNLVLSTHYLKTYLSSLKNKRQTLGFAAA